ncbi:FIST domain containing protein [Nitzschia inconspicua]|uniref:FIST domain containing protein n=1 Tax=Nitzschia inconspicua TaxID=303405 RepID=A0A9K3L8W4_9STRA|nr:FIST domain containing protein [Nitzschia inconspicua]
MLLHLVTTWILVLVNGSIHLSTAFSISRPILLSDRKTHSTKWRPSSSWQSTIVSSTSKRKSRYSLYYIDPRRSDATVSPSSSASNSHIEWIQAISQNDQYEEALSEVLKAWKATDNNMTRSSLALLFVSPPWADELDKITAKAQELLGSQTQLITVVGGGKVGGGDEFENPTIHCMSFFGGILPADSSVNIESFVNDADDYPESENDCQKRKTISPHNSQSINSFLVFADPYSANVERILEECSCPSISQQDHSSHCASSIVAGAVTVASHKHQSTLAVGNQVLPPGSLIRARFSGNIGLQVVVSKGCRPVGPTYRVTKVSGPAVLELDRSGP